MTVWWRSTNTLAEARELFERAKAELECEDGRRGDMVVDLCDEQGDIVEDFWIDRQMVERLDALTGAVQ